MQKSEKYLLALMIEVFIILCLTLYLLQEIMGDAADWVWRFPLYKKHLLTEWTMPYFTPGRCGGFTLAADAHSLLFTVYTAVQFIIPNTIWMTKITNFFMTLLFALGMSEWLKYFGVKSLPARLATGMIISLSGYWFFRVNYYGIFWAHGLAYMPWLMVSIEKLLNLTPEKKKAYVKELLFLVAWSFLLINGGYYWPYYAIFIIFGRVLVELVARRFGKDALIRLLIIGLCGAFALFLSYPKFGAIFKYQLNLFPRLGGEVPHWMVIGNTIELLQQVFVSLFDPRPIINRIYDSRLGAFHTYMLYMGQLSLVIIFISFTRWKTIIKTKAFWALCIAFFLQLAMTRTTHMGDLMRTIFPFFKQITHYWRGGIIWSFFAGIFIAFGYESLFNPKKNKLFIIGAILLALTFIDFFWVYKRFLNYSKLRPIPGIELITKPTFLLSDPHHRHWKECVLGNIYGYGNVQPDQPSYVPELPALSSPVKGYFNVHDIRKIFSQETEAGYYLTEDWPLWPETDRAELEKFLSYKQIIKIPKSMRMINAVCSVAWIFYLGGFLVVLWPKKYFIKKD